MYYDNNFPYEWRDLPDLPALLEELEWDFLCIFDACRWDAFNKMCVESEPVASPVSVTFKWITDVWCNDEYDWSDVTYVSGNPMTGEVSASDEIDGTFERYVKNHVEAYADHSIWNFRFGTSIPQDLTRLAKDFDPPVVVHYNQPHNPFIGDVKLNGTGNSANSELPIDEDKNTHTPGQLVQQGHVSLEMLRAAYLENVRLVWKESREIREAGRTITTADHGESLRPDDFGHGGASDRGRTVPFHTNWDVDLPDPQSVGAAPDHEWVGDSTQDDDDDVTSPNHSQTREEKLESLGYR